MDKTKNLASLLLTLSDEEYIESSLIWIYDSLLSMGVEACFPPIQGGEIRSGMKVLADESRIHRLMIDEIKTHY